MTKLPDPIYIENTTQLEQMVHTLLHETQLALDTESNSLFAYHERVCLIQLSTPTQDYLVDPLMIEDMSALGAITANPKIEVIFHAAEYDIATLKRDFGFEFNNIFDTMTAARVLALPNVGLAKLLEEYFDVHQDKRFQRADWGKRPLSSAQRQYAQIDTHYLLPLRDLIHQQLIENNALAEAEELFGYVCETRPAHHEFDTDGYWNIKGTRRLNLRQMACLRELYLWRERIADRRDMPRFKIITDDKLLHAVQVNPRNVNDLINKRVLSKNMAHRYGRQFLKALQKGWKAPLPSKPQNHRADTRISRYYDKLKNWRKVRALQRGVESDIILRKETLWAIAHAMPQTMEELAQIDQLGAWRRSQYGEEILKLLKPE